ncbi:MAG: DUF1080 domain-containing protein [Candidatus Sumerlaeota bacterium]|nr:DUF1080 domain-containing protein [Candidatus Sumerlaeota bacterium]
MRKNQSNSRAAGIRACIFGSLALLAAGALAADKAVALFNGKDTKGWKVVGKGESQWKVGKAALDSSDPKKLAVAGAGDELISCEKGVNLATEADYKDCILETEFMVSKGSNSGIKMANIYEIQLLDSFGKETADKGDCGAVYQENAPKVNACKKPGEWQTLVIDFRAPRFDDAGKKTSNAKFAKVTLNGQVVQENVEIAHGTGGGGKVATEKPSGPIFLQGDHGPVAFRNMKITPLN